MVRHNSYRNSFIAIKIHVKYVMLPLLILLLIWAFAIYLRGQYVPMPSLSKIFLPLVFAAALRSGYEFTERTYLYYSVGIFSIIAYFSLIVFWKVQWDKYFPDGYYPGQFFLDLAKLLIVILCIGYCGCAAGKKIRDFMLRRRAKSRT